MIDTDARKEQIYIEYRDKVFRYISGKITNFYEAEDLLSAVFLKVYQKLDSFDESKASLSTWIYTIARNTVIDYFRTKQELYELPETVCSGDVDESFITGENLEELACALEKLEECQRDLIILHYYSGYTLKRIAEMMGMSYANAKVIHSKALRHLKQYMEV